MMDSIYVAAFYTDEIPVSGGSESSAGLPVMILGVALPHENMPWFAKLVSDKSLPAGTVTLPEREKLAITKADRNSLLGDEKLGRICAGSAKGILL